MANEFKVKNGLIVSGSADFEQDLRVRGILTVDELHTSITSASVLFESGSTVFGNDVEDIHQFTGSLDISGSISLNGQAIGTGKLDETTFYSFTSSYISDSGSFDGRLDDLESFSSSLDTSFLSETEFGSYTSSANNRLGALETASGSIRSDFNTFTSSYTTGAFTGSFIGDGSNLYNIPASGVTGLNLTQIADGAVTASVSNANGLRVNSKTEITGSLIVTDGITGSIDYSNITNKPTLISGSSQVNIAGTTGYSTFSSSIASTDLSQNNRLDSIETSTSSLNSFTSSAGGRLTSLESASSSIRSDFNSYTSSNNGRVNAIETATSSLNSFTSSINTAIKDKLNSENVVSGSSQIIYSGITNIPSGIVSGSSQIDITGTTGYSTFSSSIATTDSNQNGRLDSIENKTGSYATTGSNTFVGSQTISGSVIIRENLTVLGSSSITYTTSSQLRVDDNVITVNTSNPAERFGGLQVYDSGSVGEATGSLFWDSQKNRWIYQQTSESTYGGGVLLSGPRSSGSLGDELTLTNGKIARSAGGDHLNDSIITEYSGTTIGIDGSLEITGSLISTVTPLVSGSAQITFNGITDKPTLVSGSSQVLNGSGVWSGSAQLPTGVVSGSSQVIYSGITGTPSGIVSGSSQVIYSGITGVPSGIVSGSSQVSFGGISGVPSGLVSGSSQVLNGTGIWSGSAQLPSGVVSGSSQITYSGLTGIPSGIVSGSSQITYSGLTGTPSGIVSGSSQITYSGLTGIPSGIVSGSSQITLSSTSGFGSYLNQAVLTTSSPTFSTVSATTFTGALSGNAATASTVSLSSGTAITHTGSGNINLARWTGSGSPVPFTISAAGSSNSNSATYGTLLIDRSNVDTNGAGANFHFTLLGVEYGGMGVTAETGISSGVTVGKMRWYLTTTTNSNRQEKMTLDSSGTLVVNGDIYSGGASAARFKSDGTNTYIDAIPAGGGVVMRVGGAVTAFTVSADKSANLVGPLTVGSANPVTGASLYVTRQGGQPTIKGSTLNGGDGQIVIDAASNSSNVYLQNYTTSNVYLCTGGGTTHSGLLIPHSNNAFDLGSSSNGWRNVYTNDLHLSNMGKPEGNDIDGTKGNWTIQEGEENLYIINNNNGKKFKISLEEIK